MAKVAATASHLLPKLCFSSTHYLQLNPRIKFLTTSFRGSSRVQASNPKREEQDSSMNNNTSPSFISEVRFHFLWSQKWTSLRCLVYISWTYLSGYCGLWMKFSILSEYLLNFQEDLKYLVKLGGGSVVGAAVIKYGSIILPEITRPNIIQALIMVSAPVVVAVWLLLKQSRQDWGRNVSSVWYSIANPTVKRKVMWSFLLNWVVQNEYSCSQSSAKSWIEPPLKT